MSDFVLSEKHTLTVVSLIEVRPANYPLETAARLAGVQPEILRYYCRLGLFGAARAQTEIEPTFDDNALYELRRIEHYRRHHGVNRQALPLLCDLWREIDRLQAELRFLRGP
jgi:DNA-binding transcriptional MerR regulator